MCSAEVTYSSMKTRLSPKADSARPWQSLRADSKSDSSLTTCIPIPPPPEAALIINGNPISEAIASASLESEIGSLVPFATGIPAFDMASLAAILSPNSLSESGEGPMKVMPSSASRCAKVAFSERKPYPGCTASAPTSLAAEIIASMSRYDASGSSLEIRKPSSASLTGSDILSSRP